MTDKKYLLVLNAGSSSLKFSVFEFNQKILGDEFMSGGVTKNGSACDLVYKIKNREKRFHYSHSFSIKTAWHYLHDVLATSNIVYVGFRMVHGGTEFTQTVKIDKDFIQKISKYSQLAPLHNPPAMELIKLAKATWPRLKMSVSFDTAWYQGMKPENFIYPIPLKYYHSHGLRKYGFHGLSHEMAAEFAAKKLKKSLSRLEVVTCHLGSGNSITWFARGRVIDTSMGFSPNEGLLMSTRSGDLPPDVVLFLAEELKMSPDRIRQLLNKESGLLGLAGTADLREILLANGYRIAGYRSSLKFSAKQKQVAKLALAKYIFSIRRYLASYIGMAENLDALVFAGVVGAQSEIVRKLVLKGLLLPKHTKIFVAHSDENINLAGKTLKCLA